MGKLNIAHHKSYHPYRRDNIERVRRDEEEARREEAKEEGRMMLADSEARIELLRERAGVVAKSKKKGKEEDLDEIIVAASTSTSSYGTGMGAALPTTNGHINFFEDLEQNAIATVIRASKKAAPAETDKGVPLAPSTKDLNPWYSDKNGDHQDDENEERKNREAARKLRHDPLTSITRQLASRPSSAPSSHANTHRSKQLQQMPPPPASGGAGTATHERLRRESSERERALALKRRKERELAGSVTPSTVHGGDLDEGYGDQFNRREVEEAHRYRERRWNHRDRGWDDDRDGRDSSRRYW